MSAAYVRDHYGVSTKCRHCGKRIVFVNYALGPSWVHQDEGKAFMDDTHTFCHLTRAEPTKEAPDD